MLYPSINYLCGVIDDRLGQSRLELASKLKTDGYDCQGTLKRIKGKANGSQTMGLALLRKRLSRDYPATIDPCGLQRRKRPTLCLVGIPDYSAYT